MSELPELLVVFLQKDREEYTKRTLDSFVKYAEGIRWQGWYADDASMDRKLMYELAESHGMRPLIQHWQQCGCTTTTREMVNILIQQYPPDQLVLYLQNDFEFVRPIPLAHIVRIFDELPDIGWVRTAGHWNNGPGQSGIPEDWIKELRPAYWDDYQLDGEVFELGYSYFCYNPPPFVPLGTFHWVLQGAEKEYEVALNATKTGKWTARFKNNVAYHIGRIHSVGFRH